MSLKAQITSGSRGVLIHGEPPLMSLAGPPNLGSPPRKAVWAGSPRSQSVAQNVPSRTQNSLHHRHTPGDSPMNCRNASGLTLERDVFHFGATCHAAITFRDQHVAHLSPGSTTTSAGSWHCGHSRAGERSSTSLAARVIRIKSKVEIARSTVFLCQ